MNKRHSLDVVGTSWAHPCGRGRTVLHELLGWEAKNYGHVCTNPLARDSWYHSTFKDFGEEVLESLGFLWQCRTIEVAKSQEVTKILVTLKLLQNIFWVGPFDRTGGRVKTVELEIYGCKLCVLCEQSKTMVIG